MIGQPSHDGIADITGVYQRIIIPEAQYDEAVVAQERIAGMIVGQIQVLAAIQLHDQPMIDAEEVRRSIPTSGECARRACPGH